MNGDKAIQIKSLQWASCQICKSAGCACDGNAGNVFPATRGLAIPTCITARAWRTNLHFNSQYGSAKNLSIDLHVAALEGTSNAENVSMAWCRHIGVMNRYSISQEICTRFCCALLCYGYAIVHNEFTWSIYPYSSGLLCCTGAIVRLPQCQWSKPGGYGKISQCITTTKHSKAKTVCLFLGIYSTIVTDGLVT